MPQNKKKSLKARKIFKKSLEMVKKLKKGSKVVYSVKNVRNGPK
jgi:hypothetical protein